MGTDSRPSRLTADRIPAAMRFLAARLDTSLFMLSVLANHGHVMSESLNSGDFVEIHEHGEIIALACLTRRADLLLQVGSRTDLVEDLVNGFAASNVRPKGVVAEWTAADAAWRIFQQGIDLKDSFASRSDVRHRRIEAMDQMPPVERGTVRLLAPSDVDRWLPLCLAFTSEVSWPQPVDPHTYRHRFSQQAANQQWWAAIDYDGAIASMACLDLVCRVDADICGGHIGYVFTRPESRGQGLAREVLTRLFHDARQIHRITNLILFSDPSNESARRLYERLGFVCQGQVGVFRGERRSN